MSRGAVLSPEFLCPPSSLHLPPEITLGSGYLPRQAQQTTEGLMDQMAARRAYQWCRRALFSNMDSSRWWNQTYKGYEEKQEQGESRTTSHRNDRAAVCGGGAEPFTPSGEKGTEKDHHVCEAPRAAILAEKNKNQSNTRDRGSFTEAPLNTALLPHLLWVTGKGKSRALGSHFIVCSLLWRF